MQFSFVAGGILAFEGEMERSPWRSMWLHPRETVRNIVQTDPKRSVWTLAAIYGFSSLLNLFQTLGLGAVFHTLILLLLAFVLSPFWGMLIFSCFSWVVLITGKCFRGMGNFSALRAAYSWSCVPLIFNAFCWILLALYFGRSVFMGGPQGILTQGELIFLYGLLVLKLVLAVWSFVLYINALAEVQQFSALRSIGNFVFATLIFFIVLGLGFMWLFKMMGN